MEKSDGAKTEKLQAVEKLEDANEAGGKNSGRCTKGESSKPLTEEPFLADTIITMALDFVGINKINLHQPLAQFGTLLLGENDAASARKFITKLSTATRVLFPKDYDVLMPIMPSVLVNGCEGIGTGWSTFIPRYDPLEISANIRRLMAGETMVPMDPCYRGFEGTIEKTASNEGGSTYTVTGVCEEVDGTTLRITILPIRSWADDYKEFLQRMKTDNGPFIESIRAYNDDTSVRFELKLSEENMMMARQEGFLKILKFTTTIATTNMHLFDENAVMKRYATPEKILEDFFVLGRQHYEKKKKVMLANLERKRLKVEEQLRFMRLVASGEIVVENRSRADLAEELRQRGFTPFPDSEEA